MFEFILSPGGEVKNHQFGVWYFLAWCKVFISDCPWLKQVWRAWMAQSMVRSLASYQCCPGWFRSGHGICGLRFLLVLALLRRFIFSSFSSFPPSTKTIISQIPKFERIEDAHVNQWAKKRIMFNYTTVILFCKPVNRIFSHCDWLHWSTWYWAASTCKIDSCFPTVTKKSCQR